MPTLTVDIWYCQNSHLIDPKILKTVGLIGLGGLLNLPLQKASLADFGEIHVFADELTFSPFETFSLKAFIVLDWEIHLCPCEVSYFLSLESPIKIV